MYGTGTEGDHAAAEYALRCRIEGVVRVAVREPIPDRPRGRRTIGRVAVYRPIVAHQGCGSAVPQNGTRGSIPPAGRGRIRTAGSRRNASPVRSLANVIVLAVGAAGTPCTITNLTADSHAPDARVAAATSRRENEHGTLETRPAMVDANDDQRRSNQGTVMPGRFNACHDEVAGGRSTREGRH